MKVVSKKETNMTSCSKKICSCHSNKNSIQSISPNMYSIIYDD